MMRNSPEISPETPGVICRSVAGDIVLVTEAAYQTELCAPGRLHDAGVEMIDARQGKTDAVRSECCDVLIIRVHSYNDTLAIVSHVAASQQSCLPDDFDGRALRTTPNRSTDCPR